MRVLRLPDSFDDYAWEVESKGVLWDASVVVDGRETAVTFYDPARLAQDIADDVGAGRPAAFVRLIVVARLTRDAMSAAVQGLPETFFAQ